MVVLWLWIIKLFGCFGFWLKVTILNLDVPFVSEVRISCPTNYVLLSVKNEIIIGLLP